MTIIRQWDTQVSRHSTSAYEGSPDPGLSESQSVQMVDGITISESGGDGDPSPTLIDDLQFGKTYRITIEDVTP